MSIQPTPTANPADEDTNRHITEIAEGIMLILSLLASITALRRSGVTQTPVNVLTRGIMLTEGKGPEYVLESLIRTVNSGDPATVINLTDEFVREWLKNFSITINYRQTHENE